MSKYNVFYRDKKFGTVELTKKEVPHYEETLKKGLRGAYIEEIKTNKKKLKTEEIISVEKKDVKDKKALKNIDIEVQEIKEINIIPLENAE
ncbi:MAG: hypothetical protein KAX49_07260 [Halanaerobiales bacterium]|nr:hypothetical protein [Halanaerobiales bacterium]